MKRNAQIKLLLTFIFFTFGAFFFALGIQQYKVKIGSRAQISTLAQCQRTDSSDVPTNIPCGSCDIKNGSVDSSGNASVSFACEIVCNTTGNPSNTQGCPDRTFISMVNDGSWFWCSGSGTSDCTENSSDLKTHGAMSGPWFISQQGTSQFQGSFQIPGYSECGRMQTDVYFTQIAGKVFSLGDSCEVPTIPPTTPPADTPTVPPSTPPTNTPTTPPDQPSNTPVPTETPTNTPEPTATNTPVPTETPTPTPSPTDTPVPTETPISTETPVPTATNTVAPTPTNTPSPTPTTIIAATNTPTQVQQLTVQGKPPGITPWLFILAPLGLILLGLLL